MLNKVLKMIEDMNVDLAHDLVKAYSTGDTEEVGKINAKQEAIFDLYYMIERLQREEAE